MKHFSPLAIAMLCGIPLIVLTGLVWTGTVENFDHVWRQAALDIDPPAAVSVWKGVTFLGSGLVVTTLTLAVILALALLKQWFCSLHIAFVMLGAVVIESAMKWTVQRARPDAVIAYPMPTSFSFPSGHALFATAFYGSFVVIVLPRLTGWARAVAWVTLTTLVLAIGASRIFLGVHYPSDVIAGFLAGALCIAVLQPVKRIGKTHSKNT